MKVRSEIEWLGLCIVDSDKFKLKLKITPLFVIITDLSFHCILFLGALSSPVIKMVDYIIQEVEKPS